MTRKVAVPDGTQEPEGRAMQAAVATKRLGVRWRDHTKGRAASWFERRADDGYALAVRHTRATTIAWAIAAFIVGLSLDDLHVLRVPGFLAGLAAALLIVVFGGLVLGARWTARYADLGATERLERLARHRAIGRGSLFVVLTAAFAWFIVFSAGVPPWAA